MGLLLKRWYKLLLVERQTGTSLLKYVCGLCLARDVSEMLSFFNKIVQRLKKKISKKKEMELFGLLIAVTRLAES